MKNNFWLSITLKLLLKETFFRFRMMLMINPRSYRGFKFICSLGFGGLTAISHYINQGGYVFTPCGRMGRGARKNHSTLWHMLKLSVWRRGQIKEGLGVKCFNIMLLLQYICALVRWYFTSSRDIFISFLCLGPEECWENRMTGN